jgi:hypothetical protein
VTEIVTEPLREFIEAASKGVELFFAKSGRVLPFYHFVSPIVGEVAMPAPPLDKDAAVAVMREILAQTKATRVLFVDEAWTVVRHGTRDQLDKIKDEPPPREQPDRREVVVFSGEDADEGELMAYRDIVREDGKPPRLGPLVVRERAVYSVGRMVGLLPRPDNVKVQ